ncbi:MAG TPA: PAS domain S-box protein [Burkholderiales bacterium]|nr:PAS domain S-box protein [Burkholderiales bacterium]
MFPGKTLHCTCTALITACPLLLAAADATAGPGGIWADPRLFAPAGALLAGIVLAVAAWRFLSLQRLNRDLSRAVEERRQAQASEQRLAEILAATPDVVAISDAEGRVLYLNPAGRRILGLGKDDPLRDLNASRNYTPRAFQVMESVALPAALRDGVWTGETALLGRDGREIPVLQVLIAHKNEEGKVRFFSSVMRNISERHAMERALAAERERFDAVLEGLPAFVYVQNGDRRITYANRFFKERFGDPAGRLCSEVLPCAGEDCDLCPSRRIGGGRVPGVREWTDPGSGRSYQVHDHPLPGADGSVLALQMGIDVTDRRRSEAELAAAKDRLALALEASSLALWDADVARGEVFLDEGWARMMGGEAKPTETTIARLMDQAHPDDRAYVLRMAVQAIHARVPEYRAEHRMRTKSGAWKWIQSHGRVVSRDQRGFALRMTGTNADITSRRQMEEALRQSEEKFAKAFNQSPDVIVLSTLDEGRYLEVNDAFERLTGYSRAEAIGRTTIELGVWANPGDRAQVVERMLAEGRIANHEVQLRRKSGELLTGLMSADVAVIQGRRCMLAVVRDISERKRAEERLMESKQLLDHLAHHDTLTGLPNRLLFMDRLKHGVAKAQRNEETLALMFLDLDDFKDLNDAYGHEFGDQVLAAVAARLAGSVRKSDTVSRLGGDEFTLVMEDVDDLQSVHTLAQKVIELVSQPMEIGGQRVRVGASIGISLYPSDAATADALLRLADLAMYRAKQAGRNCFQFYHMEDLPPGLRAVGGAAPRFEE